MVPSRRERILASPQFEAGRFVNRYPSSVDIQTGQQPDIRAFLFSGEDRTPSRPLPALDPREAWARRVTSGLRVTWLGHSTLLLEIDGRRILTDPVWAARASPLAFAGPKRFQPVPIAISALPTLDAVILSHDHYDHLDSAAVRKLAALCPLFVTSLGVGHHLEACGVPGEKIIELDWWEKSETVAGLTITAAPAHHFSGRGLRDRNATLWSSFVIQGERSAVYFSGDTGLSPAFREIGARLGPFDLVLLEVGAFHPSWGAVHLGPENAITAWRQLGSGQLLPIHWGTFNLAMHPWYQPAEYLWEHAGDGLLMPRLGEAVEPVLRRNPQPWWREVMG